MSVGKFSCCCSQPSQGCKACEDPPFREIPDGAEFVDSWQPTLAGYEEGLSGGAGRYLLVYCGGAIGMTVHLGTDYQPVVGDGGLPGHVSSTGFFNVWETLQHPDQTHPYLDGQWLPPRNMIALSYGKGGFYVDTGFEWFDPTPPVTQRPGDTWYNSADETTAAHIAEDHLLKLTTFQGQVFGPFQPLFGQCNVHKFISDGTAPVRMQFTAPFYSGSQPFSDPDGIGDNWRAKTAPGVDAPKFVLLRLVPAFTAGTNCGFSGGGNVYVVNLSFRNDSDFQWTGLADLALESGVVTAGQGQAWAANAHGLTSVSFQISTANRNNTATLTLYDAAGTIDTMDFDLTPLITGLAVASEGPSFVDPTRNRIHVLFTGSHGLPFTKLQAAVSATGGIVAVNNSFDGTPYPGNVVPCSPEAINCSQLAGDFVFDISTALPQPTSVVLTINFLENGAATAIPPFSATVPLVWT